MESPLQKRLKKYFLAVALLALLGLFEYGYTVTTITRVYLFGCYKETQDLYDGKTACLNSAGQVFQKQIFSLYSLIALLYIPLFIGGLGLFRKWNFQKLSIQLRKGRVLKFLLWLSFISLLFALTIGYQDLQSGSPFLTIARHFSILPIALVLFAAKVIADQDAKMRKVCEFC